MKKIAAIALALFMALQTVSFALAEGAEYSRPNDSASVLKYFSEEENLTWKYYEAEKAELSGNARINSDHQGYRGKGCVAFSYWSKGVISPGIKFTVNAPISGPQEFLVGYDNGHAFAQSANLYINGEAKGKVYFPTIEKDNWKVYGMIKVSADLKPGENIIAFTYDDLDAPSSFNVDFIAITKGETWKEEPLNIRLTIGDATIVKDTLVGEIPVKSDVAPVIKEGRTFVPLRGVLEMLDAFVYWDADKRTAIVKNDDVKIELPIGRIGVSVNGEIAIIDAPSFIENGRTMVPLRFISETLGYKVDWNGDKREITIHVK